MSRRTVALIAAVVLAALGTLVLISYVNGLEDDALKGQETLNVFVAKDTIVAGVSGDTASGQGLITGTQVPAKFVPEGAITSLQEIAGKIAAVDIFQDEIIVGARFVAPGSAIGGGLPIPAGKQAVSIQVGAPAGVNGFIQPGNQVSLIVNFDRKFVDRAGQSVDSRLDGPFAHYLLQNVDVLAVGTRVVAAATQANGETTAADTACCILTLSVSPGQAEQLVWAINNTQPYFTLLPKDAPAVRVPGRTATNLFN